MPEMQSFPSDLMTYFAPAARLDSESVKAQSDLLNHTFYPVQILDHIPIFIIILNSHRQILFANKEFRDTFRNIAVPDLLGLRPGESIECHNSSKNPGGCGTSENCRFCGAVNAIMESQEKGFSEREGVFTIQKNTALNVIIRASQIKVAGQEFTVLAFRDISQEKRRKLLERTFFHDILNLAGGLKGFLEFLPEAEPSESEELIKMATSVSNNLIDEILSQRTLVSAENGELQLNLTSVHITDLLEEARTVLRGLKVAENKKIDIFCDQLDSYIKTDKTLLRRVLLNLGKNALEAIKSGETITFECSLIQLPEQVYQFTIHNSGYIPLEIQYQLFQRSFSTKGSGRGIGTYSIKLLTENYLRGTIQFTSDRENGTKFIARYPLSIS